MDYFFVLYLYILQDALGQKLYDAANSADIPKLKELLNTNGVNINWVNAVREALFSPPQLNSVCSVQLRDKPLQP